ncbi:hypothetical protein C7212DRAFT_345630 [Tuber magnatum]|uniref:Uncharacterized protein n=1 Tax=Tuber magnatum TaxID=42249 RepID=A0A317SN28_9PEZI|nr:hypothetical protein C7212DRAFT_345630 [Tuber magnatum]
MSHSVGPAVLPKDGRPALRPPRTSGSMLKDEETDGPGTTAHKATVDKDTAYNAKVDQDTAHKATVDKDTVREATVDGDKVESESLLPIERISMLEEGLKSLTSVVDKGFDRQKR